MNFDIGFTDSFNINYKSQSKHASGYIKIANELEESFFSSLQALSKNDYLKQWLLAVDIIIQGKDRSGIVVDYADLESEIVGEWWTLYLLDKDLIAVQNQLIGRGFAIENFTNYVPHYQSIDEEGNKISEWHITLEDLIEFKQDVIRRLNP